jgi:hypothetical protein
MTVQLNEAAFLEEPVAECTDNVQSFLDNLVF